MPGRPAEADLTRLYHALQRIRRVEEEIARIYPSDKIKSPVHLSIGQEAVSVGICDVLRSDDVVAATYRGHAAYLAKGGDLPAMLAELYGKAGGCARGKGGSMHLIDMAHFMLGTSAVVATTIPVGVGYALALQREGKGRVAAVFLGDGATEEGVFYECLNFAALRKLPVLFVCENNGYAIHAPIGKRWASPDLCRRVQGFGLPARRMEEADVLKLRDAAAEAIAPMRHGGGPAFLECLTYRWREHVGPNEDFAAGYRNRSDLAPWQANDPVARVGALLPADRQAAIDRDIDAEIEAAVAFAEAQPFPVAEELNRGVFAS